MSIDIFYKLIRNKININDIKNEINKNEKKNILEMKKITNKADKLNNEIRIKNTIDNLKNNFSNKNLTNKKINAANLIIKYYKNYKLKIKKIDAVNLIIKYYKKYMIPKITNKKINKINRKEKFVNSSINNFVNF